MDLLQQLDKTGEETLLYFSLPGNQLIKKYQEGKWTVKQILIHLADAEAVLMERIKKIIAEPRQVIFAFNQDLWNEHLDYLNFPLHLSEDLFQACRHINRFLVSQHYEIHSAKEFVHSETGVRTLRMEMEKVAIHNAHHLAQIKLAIDQSIY